MGSQGIEDCRVKKSDHWKEAALPLAHLMMNVRDDVSSQGLTLPSADRKCPWELTAWPTEEVGGSL